ncbi:Clp protease N-terminal domain-containing protein [Sporichthya polymorpha]|uniref:Clp protease N-terminal domain-containing protein n=1 Tax=Sporichthya polymorpha TaxID=35751 RepID=UPI000379F990|nr:Clp protease N-terminal domain-containing protein [Sporichthya polymorpha]
MFGKLRRAKADLTLMNHLLPAAERDAQAEGVDRPGAEHLVLAALDLPDGRAAAALRAVGVSAEDLRGAIRAEHAEAVAGVGLDVDENAIDAALPPPGSPRGPYRSAGSLQTVFQRAVALAKADRSPLCSGFVLRAALEGERGTLAGALERLGVDRAALLTGLPG